MYQRAKANTRSLFLLRIVLKFRHDCCCSCGADGHISTCFGFFNYGISNVRRSGIGALLREKQPRLEGGRRIIAVELSNKTPKGKGRTRCVCVRFIVPGVEPSHATVAILVYQPVTLTCSWFSNYDMRSMRRLGVGTLPPKLRPRSEEFWNANI